MVGCLHFDMLALEGGLLNITPSACDGKEETGSVHHAAGGRLGVLWVTRDGAIRRVKNAGTDCWMEDLQVILGRKISVLFKPCASGMIVWFSNGSYFKLFQACVSMANHWI